MAFNYKEEYKRYKRYYQSLEPTLKKPITRAYTAIIFSFLVISLFGWYAIRPTMQTIFTLKREIIDKTELNKKMEDKISMLIEAQAAYQEIENNLPLIEQALPGTPEAVRAVIQLQSLAADTRVLLTNFTLSSVPLTDDSEPGIQQKQSSGIANIPVSVTVTGLYPDIKNFISGVLTLRRIIQINSMVFIPMRTAESIASGSASPSGTPIKIDLKLGVFYLSEQS